MPMGFKNSPLIMQRIMNKLLDKFKGKGVSCYMDDIVVYSNNNEEHNELLREVFEVLETNNLKINEKKIQFMQKSVMLLGIQVNGQNKRPIIEK